MTALVDCVWVKKKYAPDNIVTDRIKTRKGKARKFILQLNYYQKYYVIGSQPEYISLFYHNFVRRLITKTHYELIIFGLYKYEHCGIMTGAFIKGSGADRHYRIRLNA